MKDSRNHKRARPLGKSGNVMLIIFAVILAAVCVLTLAFALAFTLSLLNASGTGESETSALMTTEMPEYTMTSDTTEFDISATDVSSATDTAVTSEAVTSDTAGTPETTGTPDITGEPETTVEPDTTDAVTSAAKDEETVTITYKYAVYLGVKDYGTVKASGKDSFVHRFCVDGEEMLFTVATGASEDYAIQNILAEGYVYDLTVKDGAVTGAAASEPLAAGTIGSVSKDAVVVGSERISVDAGTEVYEITSLVGGAEVTAAEMTAGESVRVYGDSTARVIYLSFVADEYISPVGYTAGETTLKNFLAAAMQPVGTALYVYGGTWNWQDTGSGVLATTIGLSPTWIDFFESQTASYSYINRKDYSKSYYPHYSWNQYYYAGLDCSGYVAWTIYNTLNTESGGDGYVMSSTVMAKTLAEGYGYGTWTHTIESADELCPGDIFSMKGHVWICLGRCDDGSVVILHSTPSKSRDGYEGGGVQISGLGDSEDCEAVTLAKKYMSEYYPEWSERYEAVCKSYSYYTSTTNDSSAGRFSWCLGEGGILTDPDGYSSMSAEEILEDLFG